MTDADTRTIEQTLRISARPETVWHYWTDPQHMCDWWGSTAELDPRPGDTIMTLRHSGLPAGFADEHQAGWGHFLPLLDSAVERAAS
ncbi:MAG TPA: SRPBCC domain-containing protein [Acidimicrobiales bacterium]